MHNIIIEQGVVSVHKVLQLLGHVSFALIATPNARMHIRQLQQLVIPAQVYSQPLHTTFVRVCTVPGSDLQFWKHITAAQTWALVETQPIAHQMFSKNKINDI